MFEYIDNIYRTMKYKVYNCSTIRKASFYHRIRSTFVGYLCGSQRYTKYILMVSLTLLSNINNQLIRLFP